MPATAGRVRMPPNNRMHSSAALQTHSIWQSVIGYDPYAPIKDEPKQSSSYQPMSAVGPGPDVKNPYDNFKDIMRGVAASNTDVGDRGGCKKCGRVGHLSFQCRNFINLKVQKQENDAVLQVDTGSGMNKFKLNGAEELSEESSEESESSDSDVDSEIERAIAERNGKTGNRTKMTSLNKKRDGSDEDRHRQDRKKRDRSKKRKKCKRRSSDTDHDEGGKKRRENKKRRLDDSSDDEDRRSHLYRKSKKEKTRRRRYHDSTDDSDSDEESKRHHKRRHRKKASSNSDVSD